MLTPASKPQKSSLLFYFNLFVLLICLPWCFWTCTNEGDQGIFAPSETLVTIEPEVVGTFGTDTWIYATDNDGNVIDVKKTIDNDRLTLSGPLNIDKFNLNLVSAYNSARDTTYLTITTYADVEKGSEFDVKYGPGYSFTEASKVTFKIAGYNGPSNGIYFVNRGFYNNYTETFGANSYTADVSIYGLPSDVFLTTYRNGIPVYKKIASVKGGDNFELDLNNDFTPFEYQRKLDFEGYVNNGSVAGAYLNDKGQLASPYFYIIDSNRLFGTRKETSQPIIGYIDGFDIYQLSVWNVRNNGYVSYFKQGDLKDSFKSFKMPAFTFKALNTTLLDFKYEFSEDFTYSYTYFRSPIGKVNMTWIVYAPKGKDVRIGAAPSKILAIYPMLRPEAFNYGGSTFTKVVSGETYKNTILRFGQDNSSELERYQFIPAN